MSKDTNVPELIINKLTQEQYNRIEKSETELYLITDAKVDASEIEGLKTINGESIVGSGDITVEETFIATHGTTTYEEVKQALAGNKDVYCDYDNHRYRYLRKDTSPIQYVFSEINESESRILTLKNDNTWSYPLTTSFQKTDQMTKSTQSSDSDSNYYSTKKVNLLLSDKQNILVSGSNVKTINGESILGSGDIEIKAGEDPTWDSVTGDNKPHIYHDTSNNQDYVEGDMFINLSLTVDGSLSCDNGINTDSISSYNSSEIVVGNDIKFESGVQFEDEVSFNGGLEIPFNPPVKFDNDVTFNGVVDFTNASGVGVEALFLDFLYTLFPVGAIYQGTMSECPLATLMEGTTWELTAQGRVLQGADDEHEVGSEIPQGLPNIYGKFNVKCSQNNSTDSLDGCSGAFVLNTATRTNYRLGDGTHAKAHYRADFYASSYSSIYGANENVQPRAMAVNIWIRTN